jgi:Putative peptidoglycan binding domain/Penicillin-insensitive murein endopeptidase
MITHRPPLFEAPLAHVATESTDTCTCPTCRGFDARAYRRGWGESEWETAGVAGPRTISSHPQVNTPLPRSGPGFISSVPESQQFGLPETIRALLAIAAAWEHAHPGGPVLNIRDISLQGGGPMHGHKSHRQGIDVDIRPVRNDNKQGPITFRSSAYAQDLTQQLVDLIRVNGILRVQFIFFNDSAINGVQHWPNHDDHLHIRFFSPGAAPSPSPSSHPPVLRHGSRGSAVRDLQTRLNTWITASRPGLQQLVVDGSFGSRTLAAVQTYQQSQGLTVDGVVGSQTWARLLRQQVPPSSVPALIGRPESPPLQSTLYVNIDLGREGPGPAYPPIPAKTGIFIPENYRPQQHVDLILYLPGHKNSRDLTIDRYWHILPLRAFREKLNDSRKNVILVTPTLGLHSQAGWLAQSGGLDRYLGLVMAALSHYGPYQGQPPGVGNIILAAHSGGGSAMRQIILSNQRYSPNIRECWGFDCFYSDADPVVWARWARSRPDARLYIYYFGTARRSLALKSQGIQNVSVTRADVEHDPVPIRYWRTRIEGAPFLSGR